MDRGNVGRFVGGVDGGSGAGEESLRNNKRRQKSDQMLLFYVDVVRAICDNGGLRSKKNEILVSRCCCALDMNTHSKKNSSGHLHRKRNDVKASAQV